MDDRFKYTPDFFEKACYDELTIPEKNMFQADLDADAKLLSQFNFYKNNIFIKKESKKGQVEPDKSVSITEIRENGKGNKFIKIAIIIFILLGLFVWFYNTSNNYPYRQEALEASKIMQKQMNEDIMFLEYLKMANQAESKKDSILDYTNIINEKNGLIHILKTLGKNELEQAKKNYNSLFPSGHPKNSADNSLVRYMILIENKQKKQRSIEYFNNLTEDKKSPYSAIAKQLLK